MTKLYVATENSDQTEGRGVEIATGMFEDLNDALRKVRGRGVMGVGDGSVYEIELVNGAYEGSLFARNNLVYGYRKTPDGKWGYGFTDLRDWNPDPEFAEYQRLKKKFS